MISDNKSKTLFHLQATTNPIFWDYGYGGGEQARQAYNTILMIKKRKFASDRLNF